MTTSVFQAPPSTTFRILVNRYAGRDLGTIVEDDDAIDLIVESCLGQWNGGETARALWERYASAVEYAPPGSPTEYHAGFVPDGTDNHDEYLHAVWRDKLKSLRPTDSCGGGAIE